MNEKQLGLFILGGLGLILALGAYGADPLPVPENAPDPAPSGDVPQGNSMSDQNRAAFLAMLRHSEGTDKYPDPYLVIFGGAPSPYGYTDHPGNLGYSAWQHFTVNGQTNYSTASGAYQFRLKTWNGLASRLGLQDFSPASQDQAALQLIQDAGGLPLVDAGDVAGAIAKVNGIWASLPGSPYGQPTVPLAKLAEFFSNFAG
jgi:lysozyme